MSEAQFMRLALRLARRGYGTTSPNPMVGAVLVKGGKIIGRGWHRRAGGPHAEIEALRDAQERGHNPRGSTLFVTLEPCCTQGRTPPCTDAIIAAGIKRVVIGAVDPNPKHSRRAFKILKRAGIEVTSFGKGRARHSVRAVPGLARRRRAEDCALCQKLANECVRLNESFNHWIVHRTPFVTVKAAMTLDGKIATASGESKWITGEAARACGMKLRQGADAVLVGINTILADDPSLTFRSEKAEGRRQKESKRLRRIILDSMARTPLAAKVVSDKHAALTTIVVSKSAPKDRVAALAKRVKVIVAPVKKMGRVTPCAPFSGDNSRSRRAEDCAPYQQIDLRWLMRKLGAENVTSLLVEGGGEVNASFLLGGLAQRMSFFYAPKILGGRDSRKAVAGEGARNLAEAIQLRDAEWKRLGPDLLLTARVK
ncbi:MAG: bifunctional diaminohydroxyphosphoribosylaminopyrimidine deaminase/5-amino-6-(5-phosphoribosylamino)uracil reductase RibD [Verrucomicrobiota bacterium]|jgi:diaminohydroxyphosphoribosylaminopyrimidine deaminase/5-amino-6-(5-phosphoribosylamino)uracil reductase